MVSSAGCICAALWCRSCRSRQVVSESVKPGASGHTHPVKVGRVRPGKPQPRRLVSKGTTLGLPGRTRPTFTGWLYQDALVRGLGPNFSVLLNRHSSGIPRHVLQNLGDDMIGGDSLSFSFEIGNETVAQSSRRHRFDVVEADVEPPMG